MHYMIIGRDFRDDNSLERHLQVRQQHLDFGKELYEQKKLIYACTIMEGQTMTGSMMLFDFKNELELNSYLESEPYVIHKVWDEIKVDTVNVPDILLNLSTVK